MASMCTGCLKPLRIYEINISEPYHPYEIGDCQECGSNVVEVDDLVLDSIIELNKKGWKTKYCCSGHLNEFCVGTYIYFENKPSTKPVGFEFDDDCIRYKDRHKKLEGLDGFKELVRLNTNLYKWALNLPAREEK